ncbi:sugar O-acetyltransferase [Bifidobacterium aquikefiri]|uniref:sugar O-acetyltransferase n=2 Tax=Bifidobacterium aquikefiri TaxID=1653207 RepID=UPI0039EB3C5A
MVRIHSGVSAAMHYRDNPGFEPFGMTDTNPKGPITCGGPVDRHAMVIRCLTDTSVGSVRRQEQCGGGNMDNVARRAQELPYHYDDPAIMGDQLAFQEELYRFNQLHPTDVHGKDKQLRRMFASIGDECHVEVPAHSNWGFHHVRMGRGVYCNVNFTCVDDADITIGDWCLFGPNVVIATAGHPILPILREHHYTYAIPVSIGSNVWVGANVSILPGVTIGDNVVIGAGSVVDRDIPSDVVAVGVPCKVLRPIGQKDRDYYLRERRLDVHE